MERFHTGEKPEHVVLLHYGPEPVTVALEGWFHFCNGRPTIEASIKEGKNVFQTHHSNEYARLTIHPPYGIIILGRARWGTGGALYPQSAI
ncbi:MAG: hypothetical protein ACOC7Y_03275, partial [Chloroflexota bacterium]